MKKLSIAFAALAMLSGAAYAGTVKEHCVTRVLSTNYNSGMEGVASTICTSAGPGMISPKDKCETKRG